MAPYKLRRSRLGMRLVLRLILRLRLKLVLRLSVLGLRGRPPIRRLPLVRLVRLLVLSLSLVWGLRRVHWELRWRLIRGLTLV